jgi:hypothetical protein
MQMIHVIVKGTKTTKSIGFSKTKMKTKVNLVLNPHHKINKCLRFSQICANKNLTKFCCKHETRTKQCYDKKTHSKLVLKRLKIIEGPTFITPLEDIIQRNLYGSFIPKHSP